MNTNYNYEIIAHAIHNKYLPTIENDYITIQNSMFNKIIINGDYVELYRHDEYFCRLNFILNYKWEISLNALLTGGFSYV